MRRPCQQRQPGSAPCRAPHPLEQAAVLPSQAAPPPHPLSAHPLIYRLLCHQLMAKASQTRRGFHSIDPICLLLSSHVCGCRKRRAPRPGLVCEPCSVGVPPQTRPYFYRNANSSSQPLHGCSWNSPSRLCAPPSLRAANACHQRLIVTSCNSPATLPHLRCAVWPGSACRVVWRLCEWWRCWRRRCRCSACCCGWVGRWTSSPALQYYMAGAGCKSLKCLSGRASAPRPALACVPPLHTAALHPTSAFGTQAGRAAAREPAAWGTDYRASEGKPCPPARLNAT